MCKRKLLVGRCGTVYKNATSPPLPPPPLPSSPNPLSMALGQLLLFGATISRQGSPRLKPVVVEISTRAHLGHVSILNSGEPATSPRPGQCVSRSSGRTAQEEGALPVCFSGEEPQEAREEEAAAASAREGGSRCCEGGRAACAVAWPQLSQLPASPGQPWPAPASPASPGGQPRPAPASPGQPRPTSLGQRPCPCSSP